MSRTILGRRTRSVLALSVAAGLIALSACSSSSDEGGDGATTYKVGFPALLTGPAAFAGVPIADGAKLAVEEINESGFLGEGSKIKLDIADIKGDPAQAIALYRQYVTDGASGVLCCGLSSEAGALAPLIKSSGVPGVVTSAILAGLADPPNVFRPVILPAESGGIYDKFFDTVLPAENLKTAVVVVTSDNDGMVGDGKVMTEALKRNGVKILKQVNTSAADTSFTGAATEIADLNPDVVVASMLGTPTALLAKSLRERNFDKRILTSYGVDSKQLFDSSSGGLANTLFAVPFAPGFTDNALATKFVTAYKAEHKSDPDMYGAQGYTAMWLLAQGIKDAGSKDPKDVGKALAKITEQDTVYGTLTYKDGQASLVEPGSYLEWTAEGTLAEWKK